MVIGTLTVDGWTVTFSTARRGLGRLPLLTVTNVTAHPEEQFYYNTPVICSDL